MAVPLDIDLSTEPDLHLDARLMRLYAEHLAADPMRRLDVHRQIMGVIGEQSRRLDAWLDESAPSLAVPS
jgi:hypothetical protein